MNYKETLFFVAKCLTINHEAHNRSIVEQALQSNSVDWDEVVKLSTAHFVFPALYCNLKRASFLSYLPEDLVDYMIYITELNRERNEQILAQAKELNTLLLEHNITPIFIKGTGNLLEGLYEDIAERMVGDIDFLFSKEDYPKVIQLLEKKGYYSNYKENNSLVSEFKHYPKLIIEDKIAAVEIHKELLNKKYASEFNYDFIKGSIQKINNSFVLNFKHQLILSAAAHHINDHGFDKKSLALRNAYDIFLLSKKTTAKYAFKKFNRLQHPLNFFLASSYLVFNNPETLEYISSKKTEKYLILFDKIICDENFEKKYFRIAEKKIKMKYLPLKFEIIFKSFFYKKYRVWLFKKIIDKNWRKEKLIQLGIKKP